MTSKMLSEYLVAIADISAISRSLDSTEIYIFHFIPGGKNIFFLFIWGKIWLEGKEKWEKGVKKWEKEGGKEREKIIMGKN